MKIFLFFITCLLMIKANADLGRYFQSCTSDNDNNVFEQYLGFANNQMEWKFIAYEDEACRVPYLVFKREFQTTVISALIVETKFIQSSYVSLTDEVTESLNMVAYCGFTDWKTNEVKDVTGKLCDHYQQLKSDENSTFNYELNENMLFWDKDPNPYISVP